jgi:hypothetical protein
MELQNLFVGIASSSAVAVFGAFLGWSYQNLLVPLWRAYGQKTPAISGTWHILATDEPQKGRQVGHVHIDQYGTRIKATYNRRKRSDGTVRTFQCEGQFTSGQLVLTSEEVDREGYNVGSIVLKLSSDGQMLKGLNVYLSHDTGEVISVPAQLSRQ